ncbi:DMT family transporter [Prosthecomicrobium sp. N25]|uniref:DMT family transporter n=1 Tax=Prosthecomicrobium sp. N25 TaxID=3129254 RepID=UPI0030784A8C
MTLRSLGLALVPVVFVLLWSTGWVVARYAAPHADPLTFLSLRYAVATVVIVVFARLSGVMLPRNRDLVRHGLVSGVLLHAIYLGGVWWAIAHGIPAGLSALIAAVQPLLTALLAPRLLGEKLDAWRWAGIGLGFVGLLIALSPKLAAAGGAPLGVILLPVAVNVAAMVAVTAGTFYQKRHLQGGDLRAIAALQYAGAFLVTLPAAFLLEDMRLDPVPELFYALAWSVLALSIGAIALLLLLIRRGEVSRAATLIYLIPPTAALQAWAVLGETLMPIQIAGMALTVVGVALASRR